MKTTPMTVKPTKEAQAIYQMVSTREEFIVAFTNTGKSDAYAEKNWSLCQQFFADSNNYTSAPAALAPVVPEKTEEELRLHIQKRFTVMDKMAVGVIAGTIRSLMISGAPGIGKTYTLEKKLEEAANAGQINFEMLKGKVSPLGLYVKLYEMSDEGDVLVLDDVDVFGNEDILNTLKAALDTGEKRILSWASTSSYLEENDIPRSFEFKGTVVFITNTDIDAEIQRGTKIAPHLSALSSRSIYLDLGVHTNREIMVRVEDVITTTDMMKNRGLDNFQTVEALEWMKEHVNNLRSVSLRTALYLADFIKTDEDWKDLAEVTLLR